MVYSDSPTYELTRSHSKLILSLTFVVVQNNNLGTSRTSNNLISDLLYYIIDKSFIYTWSNIVIPSITSAYLLSSNPSHISSEVPMFNHLAFTLSIYDI
jgi:hypothetical protein